MNPASDKCITYLQGASERMEAANELLDRCYDSDVYPGMSTDTSELLGRIRIDLRNARIKASALITQVKRYGLG